MSSALRPPILVEDARGLERLLAALRDEDEVAIDTEADSFYSYREKVCLIQVTAGERDWLVDPLAGFDLAPFGELLADPRKLKIFHDGEYDVLLFKRVYGFAFANLFDTRVAAATLGSKTPGLASVLRERFGVELDKALQRSNWAQRPLSAAQIEYARLDTHFLVPLAAQLREELRAADRLVIVEGECLRLERIEPQETSFDPDEFARLKGARKLSPPERSALRELYAWREARAAELDEPPFRILNNEVLMVLARARPRAMHELARVHGFRGRVLKRYGTEVLEALARAAERGPIERFPELPSRDGTSELSDESWELHERLKQWRKERAAQSGVEAAYLVNRHTLLALARARATSREALARIEGLLPWQLERLGEDLLGVVRRFEHDLAAGRVELERRRPRSRRG